MRPGIRCFSLFWLACGLSCGKADPPVPITPVTFAVWGNSGLARDGGAALVSLIGIVNEHPIEFAADLGNRLPEGASSGGVDVLWKEIDRTLETSGTPVYPVAGANDIFDSASDIAYTARYGPPWYSFTRGGMTFIVLHTGDGSHEHGFGVAPRFGDAQLDWLRTVVRGAGNAPLVLLMHHPLWADAPRLWHDTLLPILRGGKPVLAVACSPRGMCDWGVVDGIRAVTTGCVGPMEETDIGLSPHALLVTVKGREIGFRTVRPDGSEREGITVTEKTRALAEKLVRSLLPPPVDASGGGAIAHAFDLSPRNGFTETVSGDFSFTVSGGTSWNIQPPGNDISLEPGASSVFHLMARAVSPDLGPLPAYRLRLRVGETVICDRESCMTMRIPAPRTGIPVPIEARVPAKLSWGFGSSFLHVPVDVGGPDVCGRLAVYCMAESDVPVCVYISDLKDLRPGVNDFTWNGCDFDGSRVSAGPLSYAVFVYNKKAPVTWVADGPAGESGSFTVERGPSGLAGMTLDRGGFRRYRIGASRGGPRADDGERFDALLDGLAPVGSARDGERRLFVSTRAGIAAFRMAGGKLEPETSFADGGYFRLTEYRGRQAGGVAFGGGKLYLGLGGGVGHGPSVLVLDSGTGKVLSEIDLLEYFDDTPVPPAVAADDRGFTVAHPVEELIVRFSPDGEVRWVNEPGDGIGDQDGDGRTFISGIGSDAFGNTYVTTPGTSARCGVIAPDGRGLFRVILVQLPGLRVSAVAPRIEGKPSDGLYFVTRGGDRPYVFHVPFTIRTGEIVRAR